MSIEIYKVDAVHPVLRRIIKSNLKKNEADCLVLELIDNGYDENNILVSLQNVIFEEGDELEIHYEDYDKLKYKTYDDDIDRERSGLKWYLEFTFGNGQVLTEDVFPIKGKLKKERHDRHSFVLNLYFNYKEYMIVNSLEHLGFRFKYPENEILPLIKCDDCYLNPVELIQKGLMQEYDMKEQQAIQYLAPILHIAYKKQIDLCHDSC